MVTTLGIPAALMLRGARCSGHDRCSPCRRQGCLSIRTNATARLRSRPPGKVKLHVVSFLKTFEAGDFSSVSAHTPASLSGIAVGHRLYHQTRIIAQPCHIVHGSFAAESDSHSIPANNNSLIQLCQPNCVSRFLASSSPK